MSIEDDTCVMTIGNYKAHFTGYQPKLRASQEFCEDIPAVGNAVIVLDFIDRPLRKMIIDFRIIRDVKKIGETAELSDLGTESDIEMATILYKKPELYENGSFSVKYDFLSKGRFIGILTASASYADGETVLHTSVFPFSVGLKDWWKALGYLLLVILIGIGLYFGFQPNREHE